MVPSGLGTQASEMLEELGSVVAWISHCSLLTLSYCAQRPTVLLLPDYAVLGFTAQGGDSPFGELITM